MEVEDEDAFEGREELGSGGSKGSKKKRLLSQKKRRRRPSMRLTRKKNRQSISIIKPVFVLEAERNTIAERERLKAKERAHEELTKRRVEQRKVETRLIVVEEIQKSEQIHRNMELEANVTDEDTDDEVNEAEEHKTREIERIKRDREAQKEKEETEKLRNVTEEERIEWERKNPMPAPTPKQKRRFMQKYYHKGAFFQDDPDDPAATVGADNIYHRDFSAPTGEDKMDKTITNHISDMNIIEPQNILHMQFACYLLSHEFNNSLQLLYDWRSVLGRKEKHDIRTLNLTYF